MHLISNTSGNDAEKQLDDELYLYILYSIRHHEDKKYNL